MSLTRFHRETSQAMEAGPLSTLDERTLAAQEKVRDRWLAADEFKPAVSAVLGNWTSGNCIHFMRPLAIRLLRERNYRLYDHLWLRSIKRQVDTFFNYYSRFKKKGDTFETVRKVDHTRFDPTNYDHYFDERVAASFLLSELMDALSEWRQQLCNYGRPVDIADGIEQSVVALKRPKITVPPAT